MTKGVSSFFFFFFLPLAGSDHTPLADALPDPAGRHPLGPAGAALSLSLALPIVGQSVGGRGSVIVRHQVAVVSHKVAPQLGKIVHAGGQEELDAAEDVQKGLYYNPPKKKIHIFINQFRLAQN